MAPQRILAADSTSLIAQITRAAIDLIERKAVIIEVRSGADALAELKRGGVNLLVCAADLADTDGFALASRANSFAPDVPIILLTSVHDPDRAGDWPVDAPVYPLVREADGDRFVRMLRAVLDGTNPAATEAKSPTTIANDLGPVPPINTGAMGDMLRALLTDVGAMAVVLLDRNGEILHELGAVGYLDRERLATTLSPIFANMVSIGPIVGGTQPQAMHFYDGEAFDIFALAVGLHHFLCLIFEGAAGVRAFGAVTMYGRRTVQDMVELIGPPAFAVTAPVVKAQSREATLLRPPRRLFAEQIKTPEAPTPEPAPARPERRTNDVPVSKPKPTPAASLEPLPDDADLEAVLAGLEKLDLGQVDDLFDPERLAAIAAEAGNGEQISFEEAQQMGFMKD